MKVIIEGKVVSAAPQVQTFCIDEDAAGQRLDNFLLRQLKGVPKSHVYRLIRSGQVRLNKGRTSADVRLQAADLLRLPPVRVSPRMAQKEQAMAQSATLAPAFAVLFEDEHLIAIDKPAGTAVHGGSGLSFGVIEQLRMARPQARFLELVHRLDRQTSGILLVAKKRSALTRLQDQFRARQTGKTYLTLVRGQWPATLKLLDQALYKYVLTNAIGSGEQRHVKVVAADDPNGRSAITLVRRRQCSQHYSLLEVSIKTGRTHQIRVHLAHAGFPILGDDKYGDFEHNRQLAKAGLKRMFLHAWKLQLQHPASGEALQLQAELPPELAQFVAAVLPPSPGLLDA